jgi:hypothetical protein
MAHWYWGWVSIRDVFLPTNWYPYGPVTPPVLSGYQVALGVSVYLGIGLARAPYLVISPTSTIYEKCRDIVILTSIILPVYRGYTCTPLSSRQHPPILTPCIAASCTSNYHPYW